MGCWISSGPTPGPKQYAGSATMPCEWTFNCTSNLIPGSVTPVKCPGVFHGKPYTQKVQMTCTCIIYTSCGAYTDDFDCSYDINGIEWEGGCDIGGTNCCPDGSHPTSPNPGDIPETPPDTIF